MTSGTIASSPSARPSDVEHAAPAGWLGARALEKSGLGEVHGAKAGEQ